MARSMGFRFLLVFFTALSATAEPQGLFNSLNPFNLGNGGGSGSSTTTSTAGVTTTGPGGVTAAGVRAGRERADVIAIHGLLGAIVFAVTFPFGAIIIRALNFQGLVWVHATVQTISYIGALVVMGLGISIVLNVPGFSFGMAHPVIGLIVICGLFLQPFLGFLHHRLYASHGSPNVATRPHRWTGRILIRLGIINAGLGLDLANARSREVAAYIVIATFVEVVWLAIIGYSWLKPRAKGKQIERETKVVETLQRNPTVSRVNRIGTNGSYSGGSRWSKDVESGLGTTQKHR